MNNTKGKPVFRVRFPLRDCKPCAFRSSCTTAKARTVTLQVRERHEALVAARAREDTDAFKLLYAKRAGIEGSISVGVRAFELRRSRYVGLAKTCLQHLAMASALNLMRVADWLAGEPRAMTRLARFERVMLGAA